MRNDENKVVKSEIATLPPKQSNCGFKVHQVGAPILDLLQLATMTFGGPDIESASLKLN